MAIRPNLKRAVPKTKNTAKDYNDNFDLMMEFVDDTLDECKDYVDGFMPSQTGNAGKYLTTNGTIASWVSVGENFPSASYIDGLIVTKSNNNTIAVSAGSCYDSTKTYILRLNSDTTKQNENQASNATYYVYIIGNLSSVTILISASSSSPTLPSGYIYQRQIGNYTTDSSGKINKIASYGINSGADHNSGVVFLPDYSAGISVTVSTTNVSQTISEPMCVEYVGGPWTNSSGQFYINDVLHWAMGYQNTIGIVYQKYLESGTYSFRVNTTGHTQTITLYPLKGV